MYPSSPCVFHLTVQNGHSAIVFKGCCHIAKLPIKGSTTLHYKRRMRVCAYFPLFLPTLHFIKFEKG